MGAAWRQAPKGERFEAVLDMVRGVRALGMEACVTLGMLDEGQAKSLVEAGLTAYNHNLDTGPEFYGEIVTTRTYEDRLQTLAAEKAIPMEATLAVGDGANDLDMIRASGLGVALHAKPHVAAEAQVRIDHGDLTALLYLQGYTDDEIVR